MYNIRADQFSNGVLSQPGLIFHPLGPFNPPINCFFSESFSLNAQQRK